MADDTTASAPGADVPGYDDYASAFERLRAANAVNQPFSPSDVDIVRRGNSTHHDRYIAAAPSSPSQSGAPTTPQTAPPASTDDPNSWWNIGKRALINTAMAGPDLAAQVAPFVNPYLGLSNPKVLPSQDFGQQLGVPEMGANASPQQKFGEAIAPSVISSIIPVIGEASAAAKAAQGVSIASKLAAAVPAALKSFAVNAAIRPALSTAGSYIGEKVGGEGGRLIGGIAGGLGPELGQGLGYLGRNFIAAPAYKYWSSAPADNPYVPSGSAVAAAADRMSNLGEQMSSIVGGKPGQRLEEPFPVTYGMLGNRAAMTEQAELAEAGARSAHLAQEAPVDFLPRAAELAIMQRRELPPMTPGNAPVIQAAAQARTNAIARGVGPADVYDDSTLNAMGSWIHNAMGGQNVDVTPTFDTMTRMASAPGGVAAPTVQPVGLGDAGARNAMAAQAGNLEAIGTRVPDPITGQPRLMVPYNALQEWKKRIGLQTVYKNNTVSGLSGPAYQHAYGSITNDILDAGSRAGVNPDALAAATEIEHRELAARDLAPILKQMTVPGGKSPIPGIDTILNYFPAKNPQQLYSRVAGGDYIPQGAPMPISGSGDIRQTLDDLATLHRSTTIPQQLGVGTAGWIQKGRQALGIGGAGPVLGALASTAMGVPTLEGMGAGAALGWGAERAVPYAANWFRSNIQQSPEVLSAMAGRPVQGVRPAAPSSSLTDTLLKILGPGAAATNYATRRPSEQEHPEAPLLPPQNPYNYPPGRQSSLRNLPTTGGMLAALNRANYGNSRTMTPA